MMEKEREKLVKESETVRLGVFGTPAARG